MKFQGVCCGRSKKDNDRVMRHDEGMSENLAQPPTSTF